MDNGTTAPAGNPAPMSPVPTEDEMNKVREIFQRALDAIVGMSKLNEEVASLRAAVASTQADTDHYRRQIGNLDEALAHVRAERDKLSQELSVARHDLAVVQGDNSRLTSEIENLRHNVANLQRELDLARKDRDDHGYRVMELEDQLKAATTKLEAIKEGFASIFGGTMLEPPKTTSIEVKPSPEVMPVEVKQEWPYASPPVPSAEPEAPKPHSDPEPWRNW